MKVTSAQICLTVVCFVFGALLMVQFRTQGKIAKTLQTESSADQAQIVSNLYDANIALRKEVGTLEQQLRERRDSSDAFHADELAVDLQKLRVINGTLPAVGPGVNLRIEADIRAEDLQDLINELRNAGAEALALNDERITYRSAVTSARGVLYLSGRPLSQPYVFAAIGASDTLERALTRKGGLVSYLQNTYPEATISVQKRTKVALPRASDAPDFAIAQAIRPAS